MFFPNAWLNRPCVFEKKAWEAVGTAHAVSLSASPIPSRTRRKERRARVQGWHPDPLVAIEPDGRTIFLREWDLLGGWVFYKAVFSMILVCQLGSAS